MAPTLHFNVVTYTHARCNRVGRTSARLTENIEQCLITARATVVIPMRARNDRHTKTHMQQRNYLYNKKKGHVNSLRRIIDGLMAWKFQ